MSFICDICNTKTSTRYNLGKHKQSETCQKIKREIEQLNKINELLKKNKEQEELIKKYKIIIEENNLTISTLKNKNKNLENKNKTLEEKSEEYRKIVEKAATKSTKTVNNNNNNNNKNTYTHNNYLNYISNEPIKFSELSNQLKSFVNTNSIMFDENDFHDHIVDNILKDEDGKDKLLCTDINRKNFSYKDERSGELICDPELERLRDKLKKGSDIKSVKKELLDKLIEKYENTNTDPYLKFYEILKKLDFGNPFVEHVAKKTYIKTKSNHSSINDDVSPDIFEFIS
jgi:hypothetical protein